MSNYNITLQSNNTDLQAILNTINELPNAGGSGIELPSLTNEGTASDLLYGKQLIDGDGSVVTGTFSIDAELTTQDDLISQIQSAIDNLPEAGAATTLFGSHIINQPPSSPIDTEIVLNSLVKTFFVNDDGKAIHEGIDKIIFNANEGIVKFIPISSNLDIKIYHYNRDIYEPAWDNGENAIYTEPYVSIIDFMVPTELSQRDYNALVSIMSISDPTPYEMGYSFGYDVGYTDCEGEMSTGSILDSIGYMPLYVSNNLSYDIIVNGGYCIFGAVPYYVGVPIQFMAECSAEEFSSNFVYAVSVDDEEDITQLNMVYSEISIEGVTMVCGAITDRFIDPLYYYLLFTEEELF